MTLQDLKKHVAEQEENRAKSLFKFGDSLPDNLSADGLTADECSQDSFDRNKHFTMGLFGNKEWLFSGFEENQPLTYETLLGASDVYLLFIENQIVNATYMRWFMEVGGRLVELMLQGHWETRAEMSLPLETHRDYKNHVSSLGHNLALAYSTYCGGFGFPRSFTPFDNIGGLPVSWEQIYIPMLRSKGVNDPDSCSPRKIKSLLKKEFEYYYELFSFLRTDHEKSAKFETGASPSLRLFLDSRRDPFLAKGDHIISQTPTNENLIVKDSNESPIFYRVKNNDWLNIEQLNNPPLAIDCYVAHALKNEQSEFDFDRYCEAI